MLLDYHVIFFLTVELCRWPSTGSSDQGGGPNLAGQVFRWWRVADVLGRHEKVAKGAGDYRGNDAYRCGVLRGPDDCSSCPGCGSHPQLPPLARQQSRGGNRVQAVAARVAASQRSEAGAGPSCTRVAM
eukprot:5150448-Pleurochrysis_carterae.AAC.2